MEKNYDCVGGCYYKSLGFHFIQIFNHCHHSTLWQIETWGSLHQSQPQLQQMTYHRVNLSKISAASAHAAAAAAKSFQSCLTLCDPRDGSPPGFPVLGILQARTLEWGAIAFSNV